MTNELSECRLCPRNCGGNRLLGEKGYCKEDARIFIGRIAPHYWEEPCISGEKGSGAVFFAGCNMGCVFCQNKELSRGKKGKEYTVEELVVACLQLQEQGCHNINLVTPSHYVIQVVEVIKMAKEQGLTIPIVYNTSGYETVESLRRLEGLVDIYLPDFKYMDNLLAKKYSQAENYPEVARAAMEEMIRQQPTPIFEGELLKRGVVVRHLVLPGALSNSKQVIKYLYENFGKQIYISIMNQYTPYGKIEKFPELQRKLTEEEYDEVVDYAINLGVEQGFIQEGDTAEESFIPEFEGEM